MKTLSTIRSVSRLTILVLLLCSTSLYAQVYTRRLAASSTRGLAEYGVSSIRPGNIPTLTLPAVNTNALLVEDEQQAKLGYPYRFGINQPVDVDLINKSLKNEEKGYIVYRYQIDSPGAYSINLIFDRFQLVQNAKLYLYNADRTVLVGPIDATSNPSNNVFWTDLVSGSQMIIELQEPVQSAGRSQLHISSAIHGYKDTYKDQTKSFGSSGSCEVNLVCKPDYQKEGDGVALLLLSDGTRFCSGELLNDAKQSFRSYLLSAFHCVDDDDDKVLSSAEMTAVGNWVFRFKYQSSQCTPSQDGTTYVTMNGATLRSARVESDFSLLELVKQTPAADSITYLGWDRTGGDLTDNFGIHHPRGDVKKISITNATTQIASSSYAGRPGANLWTAFWGNQGIVEGGSSGSPLFSKSRRVIGQLLGGPSSCTATGSDLQDYYGRFGISWGAGGSSATQLSNWLDPAGSNVSTTNSAKPRIDGPASFTGSGSFALNTLDDAITSWTVTGSTSAVSPITGTGKKASLTVLTSASNLTITFSVKSGQTYPIQFAKTFDVTAPTGVDVAFIIDDTGSMSEEIGGVRNALLNYLSKFTEESGLVFQLTTFKDNVTSRAPTTNLTEIKNQVAALVASGGGDCPEASVEALMAVKDKIKDGRLAIIATDASPHSGLDITGVTASLAARGVKIHTLLSGDCSVASTSPVVLRDGRSLAPPSFSDNGDGDSTPRPAASTNSLSNPTAIEAFSYISQETKGIFAYVPEVNGSNANDKKRYENIGFNILVGATSTAIAFIEPYRGPAGSTLTTTITGVNTNFNASSTITFEGTGISVGSIRVISPTKLEATVSIPAGTSLGLKNITITTGSEVAQGTGLLEVTAAPVTPTIVSIAPPSGSKGESLTVLVSGANTHFTDASTLNMGSGITISSVKAISSTQLQAVIAIAADASAGYRNVVVTTGAEVANENVIGPFLIIEAGCAPITIPGVTVPSGGTATITASGCAGTLLWSTGATTSTIMVGPLTESTTVSATCTTGSCIVSATGTITVQPASGSFTLLAPTYNCTTGAFTFNTSGGNGSPITFYAIGITGPSTNPNQFVDVELRTVADAKPITLYATQNGVTVSYVWDIRAVCPITPGGGGALTLLAPTYNCTTGAFTFNTSGGNGSPITFFAIGITGPTTNPNQFVDVGIRTATDAKPITLYATQNGVTVSYVWDLRAVCPITPGGSALTLLAPTYNCSTGAFTFNTSGGNGSTIEYRAVPGITDWTTNPNQFVDKESRTASDVQPFLLQARQGGVVTTLVWDLKAACGRARLGSTEATARMVVTVLGNPIAGETVNVEVSGGDGQPIHFQLTNLQGQLISEQDVRQATSTEQVQLQLSKSAGVYLLQVSSPNQVKVVRVLKVR